MTNEYTKYDEKTYIVYCYYKKVKHELYLDISTFRSLHRKIKGNISLKLLRGLLYPQAKIQDRFVLLHRVIMGGENKNYIFLDGNPLNCRKENIATQHKKDQAIEPLQLAAEIMEPQPGKLRRLWSKIAALTLLVWGAGAK